jgi:hypothetical protein
VNLQTRCASSCVVSDNWQGRAAKRLRLYRGVLRIRLLGESGLLCGLAYLSGERPASTRIERDSGEDGVCTTTLKHHRREGKDRLLGVIGVSSIFIAACCCDAGVESVPYCSTRSLSFGVVFSGNLVFVVNIHRLKRLYFFIFASKVRIRRSRSARRAS